MVLVIEDIHQIAVERMHILHKRVEMIEIGGVSHVTDLHLRELIDDLRELVVQRLLQELHFPRVERANATDRISAMHDGRRLPLCLRQNRLFQLLQRIAIVLQSPFAFCMSAKRARTPAVGTTVIFLKL